MSKTYRRRAAKGSVGLAVGTLIGAGLTGGLLTVQSMNAAPNDDAVATTTVTAEATASPAITTLRDLSAGFSELSERTTPAVVQIEVVTGSDSRAVAEMSPQVPEPFRRFFEQPRLPDNQTPRRGGGSGFLVSPDGIIVTNNHVVGDAEHIQVTLHDQRSYEAELLGTDPTTDVAVIRIEADEDLPHLSWGRSSDLDVGSWVMAIGSPGVGNGQLQSTVTFGIVSAKGRPLQLIGRGLAADPRYGREMAGYAIENFIQTDAVINPGNSGGPMVNLDGEVVGMNTAIASTDGHYQGYGFAIPSDLVMKVAADLVEHGEVRRPWLGVQVMAVTPEDAEAFDLPSVSGVVVQSVTEDGPAESAGLEQGDVIVSLGGVAVASGGDLQERVAIHDQGDRVDVGIYRDGRERTVEVRLGEMPSLGRSDARPAATEASESVTESRLGIAVRPLDERVADELGFERAGGVIVSDVDTFGPAADRGIATGLKIVRIGDTPIADTDDVADALGEVESGSVVTLIVEDATGAQRIVNVRTR